MRPNNRLTQLLSMKKRDLLSIYMTAGYPQLSDTLPILGALEKAGVDFVEIGVPFSDPLADGAVIQRSSERALKNGISLKVLFSQLRELRKIVQMPVLLMGYLNPVLQFGIERFAQEASELGIDGTIIPDLPLDYYKLHFKEPFERYGLSHVFLVTPQTEDARVIEFAAASSAFLYAVSGFGVTGNRDLTHDNGQYLARLQELAPNLPVVVGFGVRSKEDLQRISAKSSGAVIGSAFIEALSTDSAATQAAQEFVRSIR